MPLGKKMRGALLASVVLIAGVQGQDDEYVPDYGVPPCNVSTVAACFAVEPKTDELTGRQYECAWVGAFDADAYCYKEEDDSYTCDENDSDKQCGLCINVYSDGLEYSSYTCAEIRDLFAQPNQDVDLFCRDDEDAVPDYLGYNCAGDDTADDDRMGCLESLCESETTACNADDSAGGCAELLSGYEESSDDDYILNNCVLGEISAEKQAACDKLESLLQCNSKCDEDLCNRQCGAELTACEFSELCSEELMNFTYALGDEREGPLGIVYATIGYDELCTEAEPCSSEFQAFYECADVCVGSACYSDAPCTDEWATCISDDNCKSAYEHAMNALDYEITGSPTKSPTPSPTPSPTSSPSMMTRPPSMKTGAPSSMTDAPSPAPSSMTGAPSPAPSTMTDAPSLSPSKMTDAPSLSPSLTTDAPSRAPSSMTDAPSLSPSSMTNAPSTSPSTMTDTPSKMTDAPSMSPSKMTNAPSMSPSKMTDSPSMSPSSMTNAPSLSPSMETKAPSLSPSMETNAPSMSPSKMTDSPSMSPSSMTNAPSPSPSMATNAPSLSPSSMTGAPSMSPSKMTDAPSLSPSMATNAPSLSPSSMTGVPSMSPSSMTNTPSLSPSSMTDIPSMSPSSMTNTPSLSPSSMTNAPSLSPSSMTDAPTLLTDAPTPLAPPFRRRLQQSGDGDQGSDDDDDEVDLFSYLFTNYLKWYNSFVCESDTDTDCDNAEWAAVLTCANDDESECAKLFEKGNVCLGECKDKVKACFENEECGQDYDDFSKFNSYCGESGVDCSDYTDYFTFMAEYQLSVGYNQYQCMVEEASELYCDMWACFTPCFLAESVDYEREICEYGESEFEGSSSSSSSSDDSSEDESNACSDDNPFDAECMYDCGDKIGACLYDKNCTLAWNAFFEDENTDMLLAWYLNQTIEGETINEESFETFVQEEFCANVQGFRCNDEFDAVISCLYSDCLSDWPCYLGECQSKMAACQESVECNAEVAAVMEAEYNDPCCSCCDDEDASAECDGCDDNFACDEQCPSYVNQTEWVLLFPIDKSQSRVEFLTDVFDTSCDGESADCSDEFVSMVTCMANACLDGEQLTSAEEACCDCCDSETAEVGEDCSCDDDNFQCFVCFVEEEPTPSPTQSDTDGNSAEDDEDDAAIAVSTMVTAVIASVFAFINA